jgi:hypothetical protein
MLLKTKYALNASGSKILTIGTDTELNLRTSAVISKIGFTGVKLSFDQWRIFKTYLQEIQRFFSGAPSTTLKLGSTITLRFFGDRRLIFKQQFEAPATKDQPVPKLLAYVYLAEKFFNGILGLMLCIENAIELSAGYEAELPATFSTLGYAIVARRGDINAQDLPAFIRNLDVSTLPSSMKDLTMERRAHLEMLASCTFELQTYATYGSLLLIPQPFV